MANVAEVVVIVNELHKKLPTIPIPLPIADVSSAISASTQTKISIVGPENWAGNTLYGMLLRYPEETPKRAVVIIHKERLSKCWQRFVACKEMCHLLIDKEAQFTKDPIALIESFLTMTPPEKIDEAMRSERWAFFAAVEMLIPWRGRETIISMIAAGSNNLQIAKKYMVPERIVEYWRTPRYQNVLTEAWIGMEEEHERIPPQV